ncbi:Uncharacterised protein [Chlamydia trachomatis]|nr:Uncharacterised protein [Chlamydia trachomatis]
MVNIDEFDELAAGRDTVGAHSLRKRSHKWAIALVAVMLMAPLVGIGIGFFMSSIRTSTQQAQPSVAAEADSAKDSAPDESKAEDLGKKGNDDTQGAKAKEPAPIVNYSADIEIFNGSGIEGFAAAQSRVLEEKGFTNVTSDNYFKDTPEVNTVYYDTPASKATAQAVGAALGISSVIEDSAATSSENSVIVVLRSREGA